MLSAHTIKAAQDHYTALWHEQDSPPTAPGLGEEASLDDLVKGQHYANFELWHAEDDARSPRATDSDIVRSKRLIDLVNQRRNDLAERCDLLLMDYLNSRGLPIRAAPLHSETPGLMIDRLSILSLKLFHTAEQIHRNDAPEGHAERNRERHRILLDQRDSLADCLDVLWTQVLAGERRIQLYLQLKMYNDPSLSPIRHRTAKEA